MNSRRLTGPPLKQRVLPYHAVGCIVHHGKFWQPMSALGQKQTSQCLRGVSALPPKADMRERNRPVKAHCPFYYERRCRSEVCFFNLISVVGRQTFRNLLGIRTVRVKEIAMEASQAFTVGGCSVANDAF